MDKVHEMLEELLKQFAAMNTDVKTVLEEVHSLRKQVEDFGEDLDRINVQRAGTPLGQQLRCTWRASLRFGSRHSSASTAWFPGYVHGGRRQ